MAHDQQALDLLNKDLQVQERRLAEVEQHPKFCISKAMQDWFVVHHQNTAMLRELVALMANKDIKKKARLFACWLISEKSNYRYSRKTCHDTKSSAAKC